METLSYSANREAIRLSADPRFVALVDLLSDQSPDRQRALIADLEQQATRERITMPTASEDLTDSLREAIETSGKTHYQLAMESGVSASALSRFAAGERGLTLASAAKLAAVLQLELRPVPRSRRRPAK